MVTTVKAKECEYAQKIEEEKQPLKSETLIPDLRIMPLLAAILNENLQIDDRDGEQKSENQTEKTINSVKEQTSKIKEIYDILRGVSKSE